MLTHPALQTNDLRRSGAQRQLTLTRTSPNMLRVWRLRGFEVD